MASYHSDINGFFNALEALLDELDGVPLTPVAERELRTPCKPGDEVGDHAHKHMCRSCGDCWSHSNSLSGPFCGITQADHEKAHSCPSCGTKQYFKHGSI